MEMQPQEKAHEKPGHLSARGNGESGRGFSEDELIREWKAQHTAFGLVLVVYAFLMGLAPILARYPVEVNEMFCAALQTSVSWWTWVVAATALCLVAILIIALKRRHKTASGA